MAAAADDVAATARWEWGEEHGLPLLRFSLAETAAAHLAAGNGVVGKVARRSHVAGVTGPAARDRHGRGWGADGCASK